MPIEKLPGIYHYETRAYELIGEGSKIPIFIGYTGNTVTTAKIAKYNDETEALSTTTKGGIGDDEGNLLANVLKEFFEEAKMKTSNDTGVPYIYVIDLGKAEDKTLWTDAFSLAKTKAESTLEVIVGAEKVTGDYSWKDIIEAAYSSISVETENLKLRCAITTDFTADTDEKLKALTNASTGIRRGRIAIAEPFLFGKTVARICLTPFNMEPGYYPYRSVEPETFKNRTKAEQLALQNAGIIINHDEVLSYATYPKINLGVISCFAENPRPADSLLHAVFNADHLLYEVFEALYPQIKNNETVTNIAMLQTVVDGIVDKEVEEGNMLPYTEETGDGTKLTLVESDSNPYYMDLLEQILPVNSTIAIKSRAIIRTAAIKALYGGA